MIDFGRKNVLGVLVSAVDYDAAVRHIVVAGQQQRPYAVSALAVHGLMSGVLDGEHKYRLNSFDLVLPDGQPVRWAINWLYRCHLKERVYGPNLTMRLCEAAARRQLPVYFYGSTQPILDALVANLQRRWPDLPIVGVRPSSFRKLTEPERVEVVNEIRKSGAALTFVGLGCPRQEVWVYEYLNDLSMPLISVGAAFPLHAGISAQAPLWMQQHGLEWSFRLLHEPRRLWRRYLLLNPLYAGLLLLQAMGVRFSTDGQMPERQLNYG